MNKFLKIFAILVIGLSFASFTNVAQAYCRWIPSHWSYGMWYPAQRVCYGGGYMGPGYGWGWRHGYGYRHCGWHYGHRVCW